MSLTLSNMSDGDIAECLQNCPELDVSKKKRTAKNNSWVNFLIYFLLLLCEGYQTNLTSQLAGYRRTIMIILLNTSCNIFL